jgi:hypothetical protein
MFLAQEGVELTLGSPIDEMGEFVSVPIVEAFRDITSEVIGQYRKEDYTPIYRDSFWKM